MQLLQLYSYVFGLCSAIYVEHHTSKGLKTAFFVQEGSYQTILPPQKDLSRASCLHNLHLRKQKGLSLYIHFVSLDKQFAHSYIKSLYNCQKRYLDKRNKSTFADQNALNHASEIVAETNVLKELATTNTIATLELREAHYKGITTLNPSTIEPVAKLQSEITF